MAACDTTGASTGGTGREPDLASTACAGRSARTARGCADGGGGTMAAFPSREASPRGFGLVTGAGTDSATAAGAAAVTALGCTRAGAVGAGTGTG